MPPCLLLAQGVPEVLELSVAVPVEAVLAGVLEGLVVAGPVVDQAVPVAAVGLELAREGLEVAAVPEELVAGVAAVGLLPWLLLLA